MAKAKEEPKPLCFVIGPIGKDGTPERKHADLLLHSIIKEVLELEEFGYRVKRADEDADPGMIGDRVVSDIINAELVVADLTDLNPNAFYELGIRHSTEKPTIHVAKATTPLPFDNVAHRTIFVDLTDWLSITKARSALAESARRIREPDYKVSNPITQANASFKMRESADPRDRVLAQIQDRLASLEIRSRETEPAGSSSAGRRLEVIARELHRYEASDLPQANAVTQFVQHVLSNSDMSSASHRMMADESPLVTFDTPGGGKLPVVLPLREKDRT